MLGPSLETLTDELLDPTIEIVYAERLRRGLVKPAPEALNNMPIKVEYTSILAQAQKAAGTGTIERVIGFVANIAAAQQSPEAFDNLNIDAAIEAVHDAQGAPARMLRSDDEIAAIRANRAQQQRVAQAAAMAPALKQGAEAIKTAGEAVPEDGSALGAFSNMALPA